MSSPFFEQHGVSEKKADLLVDFHHAVEQITFGNIVIFFNQWNKALVYKSMKVESRQITEPANESVVQGPRESTVENLKKNIGLLRMRLSTPNFKIQSIVTGGETHTQVVYGYVEGAVDSELLKEFESRVEQLSHVEVLETAYVEQLIEDSTWSPFPQHRYTERPDVAVAAMLEGKIAVLVQGTGGILSKNGVFDDDPVASNHRIHIGFDAAEHLHRLIYFPYRADSYGFAACYYRYKGRDTAAGFL